MVAYQPRYTLHDLVTLATVKRATLLTPNAFIFYYFPFVACETHKLSAEQKTIFPENICQCSIFILSVIFATRSVVSRPGVVLPLSKSTLLEFSQGGNVRKGVPIEKHDVIDDVMRLTSFRKVSERK